MKNKDDKYWEEQAIYKDKLLDKHIKKLENKLLKSFKATRKEVLNELKIIYTDIDTSEYIKYQIEALLTRINYSIDKLYKEAEENTTEEFILLFLLMYKVTSKDLGVAFNVIDESIIKKILSSNWSGLTYSERILEHKRKLLLNIREELNKAIIRGDSLSDVSRIISDKFNISFSNAKRLVNTEACWVMNEAIIKTYKDNNIKEYEFIAILDSRTSKICRKMDGKRFKVDECVIGVNCPPLHINCRSSLKPILK